MKQREGTDRMLAIVIPPFNKFMKQKTLKCDKNVYEHVKKLCI